ncbi:hypothetical protein H6F96_30370 [Microcoleus sp. FACHB-53]|nr:hypothetical protein [Microcoleus sp. FACHB-53]
MTPKIDRLTAQVLAAALTLSGTVACSTQTVSNPGGEAAQAKTTSPEMVTTFECVSRDRGWATIAHRGNIVSKSPLITWNSLEFGSDYTPEKRCEIVSGKLTQAVAQNGGTLTGLNLTTGNVDDGQTVVCLVASGQSRCDRNNMLFTLNRENAKKPTHALSKITNFAQGKATNSTVDESRFPSLISLEMLVERSLPKDNGF